MINVEQDDQQQQQQQEPHASMDTAATFVTDVETASDVQHQEQSSRVDPESDIESGMIGGKRSRTTGFYDANDIIGHVRRRDELWDPITMGVIAAAPEWAARELSGKTVLVSAPPSSSGNDQGASKSGGQVVRQHVSAFIATALSYLAAEFNTIVGEMGRLAVNGSVEDAKRFGDLFGPLSTADFQPGDFAPFATMMRRPGAYCVFSQAGHGKSTFASAAATYANQYGIPFSYLLLSEPEPYRCIVTPNDKDKVRFEPSRPLTLRNLLSRISSAKKGPIRGVSRRIDDPDFRTDAKGQQSLLYINPDKPVRRFIVIDSIKDFITMPGFASSLGSGGFPLQLLRVISMWNSICQMSGFSLLVVANPVTLKAEYASSYAMGLKGASSGLFVLDGVTSDGELYGPAGHCTLRGLNARREVRFEMRGELLRPEGAQVDASVFAAYMPRWDATIVTSDDVQSSTADYTPFGGLP